MTIVGRLSLALVTGALIARGGVAQVQLQSSVSQCRAADSVTQARAARFSKMMTSRDEDWVARRQSYRLPVVADSAIAVVTDPAVCARAASAYNATLAPGAQKAGRKVYVLRIGPTRFAVWDVPTTDHLSDAYEVLVVFDEGFNVLASFASVG